MIPLLRHVFSSFEVGGAQMCFVALVKAFGGRYRHVVVAMGWQLRLLSSSPRPLWSALRILVPPAGRAFGPAGVKPRASSCERPKWSRRRGLILAKKFSIKWRAA
jgi:hypothetical protein